MGPGPFLVKPSSEQAQAFKITGTEAMSGIREMYVRDTYLHNGLLTIEDGFVVVDLGANMGNFTNLALACGSNIRVIAVEPNLDSNLLFNKSVGLNTGHLERVTLIRAFLGSHCDKSYSLIEDARYADAPWISEEQLIADNRLSTIDFLKCDIEGGEFGLLAKASKLLAMTCSLAIEIHAFAGSVDGFIGNLKQCGFSILAIKHAPDGSATVLAKRL